MNVFQLTFLVNKLEKHFVKQHALGHSNSRYNITFLFLAFVTIEKVCRGMLGLALVINLLFK